MTAHSHRLGTEAVRCLDHMAVDVNIGHRGSCSAQSSHRFTRTQEIRVQSPLVAGHLDSGVRRKERRLETAGIDGFDQVVQNVGVRPLNVDREANQVELLVRYDQWERSRFKRSANSRLGSRKTSCNLARVASPICSLPTRAVLTRRCKSPGDCRARTPKNRQIASSSTWGFSSRSSSRTTLIWSEGKASR